MDRVFGSVVKLAADSPSELRASDLYRVIEEAKGRGYKAVVFILWLKGSGIPSRTVERLATIEAKGV